MQCPVVPAVGAVFLASYLARNRLVRRADLVSHMVHRLVPSNLCPDDDDFILWNPNGFVTLWTKVHAQRDTALRSLEPELRIGLMIVEFP